MTTTTFKPAAFINRYPAITKVGVTVTSKGIAKAFSIPHFDEDFNYVSVKRFLDRSAYRLQKLNRYLSTRGIRVVQHLDASKRKITFTVERIERSGPYVTAQKTLSERAFARYLNAEAGASTFKGQWKNLTKNEAIAVDIPYAKKH